MLGQWYEVRHRCNANARYTIEIDSFETQLKSVLTDIILVYALMIYIIHHSLLVYL